MVCVSQGGRIHKQNVWPSALPAVVFSLYRNDFIALFCTMFLAQQILRESSSQSSILCCIEMQLEQNDPVGLLERIQIRLSK